MSKQVFMLYIYLLIYLHDIWKPNIWTFIWRTNSYMYAVWDVPRLDYYTTQQIKQPLRSKWIINVSQRQIQPIFDQIMSIYGL